MIGQSEAIQRKLKKDEEEDLELEDIVNEHHTEIQNHGGQRDEQEEQQASGSGGVNEKNEPASSIGADNMNNVGSSVVQGNRIPMTQVYYNNKNNKKKPKTGSSPHQSISNLGSARISGLKVGDNLSDKSYVPSQHSYVMQRESMIFGTI